MESKEAKELAISAIVLALAFSIALNGGIQGIAKLTANAVVISLITVSLGFLLHELGHRFVARNFGSYAEYKMWNTGLALALLFSFFGFVFAAPGAVMIHARADLWGRRSEITNKRNGLISIAGPLINIVLASVFAIGGFMYPAYRQIMNFGASINMWLALFNMLPVPPLDGSKVFYWDKRVWLAASALIVILWTVL